MKTHVHILLAFSLLLSACAQQAEQPGAEMTTLTIGAIAPLTGDGAVYGVPLQKVTQLAQRDLNEQWAGKNQRLEIIWEDGKCNGRDSLSAAQKLVNLDGVKVIAGGGCSGETLGAAPFTEQNGVVLFSSLSSSPDVTNAGDYVFRNYPSDSMQMSAMADFIVRQGYERVAILSENTDYAQAQRASYKEILPAGGVEIVADEVVNSDVRDVRSEVAKISAAQPDAILVLPQTIPMAGIFVKQLYESGVEAQGLGNDVMAVDQTIGDYPQEMDGFYGVLADYPRSAEYDRMKELTGCELGLYCATTYDAVFILGELLERCGDQDAACMRDALYATSDWQGMAGTTSFDENGDVQGGFVILKAEEGAWVPVSE